jgi:thiol-disulfide isomerase/thioredoxin/Flp pilus assembly protein TadD
MLRMLPAPARFVRTSLRFLAAVACVTAGAILTAAQDPADPKFTAAMEKGDAALKTRKFQEALDAYKDANNAAGKKSARALLGVARAYHGLEAFKNEADACADALKVVGADQALESTIHNQRGLAFLDLAQSADKPALVKDAEASFRAALALPNPPAVNWFNLGVALMKQGRDDEGAKALEAFIAHPAAVGPLATGMLDDARKLIENPRRARVPYAPDYAFTDMSGERIDSKDLLGKTILLDFWGTWCGPCVVATPTLVNLNRKFSKPRSTDAPAAFMMLGISSDSRDDAGKLREYVAKNNMNWPQLHDVTRQVHRLFAIKVFPTYIVVDGEGIIRDRMEGWNTSTSPPRLDNAISRAMRPSRLPAPLFQRPHQ